MPKSLARLSVLAFAATISTGELCAQEPPPATRPFAANAVPPAEGGPTRLFFAPTGAGQPFPVLTIAWAF
jgi:hypothetical protein